MKLLKSIVRPNKVDEVKDALAKLNIAGMTVTEVRGHGKQKGHTAIYRGKEYNVSLLPKMEIEVVVPDAIADEAIKAIVQAARTGEIGDGRVFVLPVAESYRIRDRTRWRGSDRRYSYRSASIGSRRAARTAGTMPKKMPTAAEKPRPSANDHQGSEMGKPVATWTATPMPAPSTMPEQSADRGQHDGLRQELKQDLAAAARRAPCGRRSRACARSPRSS